MVMCLLNLKSKAWTKEEVEILKKEYKRLGCQGLVEKLGRSDRSIQAKARNLKLTNPRRNLWSNDDIERLRELIVKYSATKTAKIMHRSKRSVIKKLDDLKQTRLDRDGWYNPPDVAYMLGVTEKWVRNKIHLGVLKAEDHYEDCKVVRMYHINREDLVEFVKKYPSELQGCVPDMVSFVDLLTNKE